MFEKAATRLYEARLGRDKAKKAFIEHREEHGGCEMDSRETCCYHNDYPNRLPLDEWCATCQKAQPFYLARKAACKEVGMAMRALMQLCKKSEKSEKK